MNKVAVSELMTRPACTIHANERLDKALYLFQKNRISILPVVNTNGCCVGVITLKDVVEKQNELIAECRVRGCIINEDADQPLKNMPMTFFGDISVYDGMSENFHFVRDEQTVFECLDLLLDNHIHHLPVLNKEQRLVGVVSSIDLIDYFRTYMEQFEKANPVPVE